MKSKVIYLITSILLLHGCNTKNQISHNESDANIQEDSIFERNKEAREDSIKLREAYALMRNADHTVYPAYQTIPVDEDNMEDAADDPAFWYNSDDPQSSVVFGSNKKGGVYSYHLNGDVLAYYPIGDINNIDTRSGIKIDQNTMDIIGGSNRTDNSISLMKIDKEGKLTNILSTPFIIDTTYVDEVYGFCMYKGSNGEGYAIVNGKNGQIVMYEIQPDLNQSSLVILKEVENWKLKTQPEGMVADDENGILYVGEEQYGIWKINLIEGSEPAIIPDSRPQNNSVITYDIEGLALYIPDINDSKSGFLLASIQGSFTYAIFSRGEDNQYLTNFSIGSRDNIDE